MSQERMHPLKAAAAALAALVSSWVAYEGFTSHPVVPVDGDVWTYGYGSTTDLEGNPVTPDTPPITREQALDLATRQLQSIYGACVAKSLGDTPVHVTEFRVAVDFAGQYGCPAWRNSSMLKAYQRGDYQGACSAYLKYRYMTDSKPHGPGWIAYRWNAQGKPTRWKFDCSTPGNKTCRGVWTRQQERFNDCMGAS